MNFADSFRAARWVRLINLILQAILFLTLFGGLNYIALNHAWRFDLSRNRQHSLSAETRSYLDRLDHPVDITVTLTEDPDNPELAQSFRDIRNLLREYTYQTRNNPNGRITVRYLDVYQSRREAEALHIDQPNVVVLDSDGHRRVMPLIDFYRVNMKEKKKEAFLGEVALTAAILDVSNPDKKKIYFLAGHGEMRPDDTDGAHGLSQLRDELRQRNYDLAVLDLSQTHKIPDDAALIIIAGQQGRVQPVAQRFQPGAVARMGLEGWQAAHIRDELIENLPAERQAPAAGVRVQQLARRVAGLQIGVSAQDVAEQRFARCGRQGRE
jgi:hypothetical protein